MLSYVEIKEKIRENKQQIITAICFVLVFIVGFGTGRYERELRRSLNPIQKNYNTTTAKTPLKTTDLVQAKETVQGTSTTASSACVVKGNISTAGKKIFHVKGGAFYDRVKPEQCFGSEAEAISSGYIKSSR